jgi:uncharacterized protein
VVDVSTKDDALSCADYNEYNKAVALAYFAALSCNDVKAMARLMTDDAIWWFAPGTRLSGLHSKADFLAKMAMLHADAASSLDMEFYEITAEGDRVAIVAKGSLPLKDGRVFRSNYNFLLHIRSGKISSGKAFLDAIHANEIFGPPDA